MLLVSHIIIALSSIVGTTLTLLRPSRAKLKVSYSLVAATLATGTYLVWSTHSPLVASCTTGLIYISVVSFGLWRAHYQLLQFEKISDR